MFKLFTLLIIGYSLKNFHPSSKAYELEVSDIHKFTNLKKALLFVHKNDCNYCQNVLSYFDDLVTDLYNQDQELVIGKVNLSENSEVGATLQIRGVPHFRMYLDDYFTVFKDIPSKESLTKWATSLLQNPNSPKEISTPKEFEEVKAKKSSVLYIFPFEDGETFIELKKIARIIPDIEFFYSSNQALLKEYETGNDKYNIAFLRKFDDGNKFISSSVPINPKALIDFLTNFSYQMLHFMSEETTNFIFKHRMPSIFLYVKDPKCQEVEYFTELAYEFGTGLIFTIAKMEDINAEAIAGILAIDKKSLPAIRILEFAPGVFKKYKLENLGKDSIRKFVEDFNSKKLEPFYKSMPVPKQQDAILKEVVRENFKEIVLDDQKHVLVAFVTNWCSHCKEVKPTFTKAVALLKNKAYEHRIIFAIVNVEENDIDDVHFKEFPQIKLYKRFNKENSLSYDGLREPELILDFLQKELHTPVLYDKPMPKDLEEQLNKQKSGINEDVETHEL